MSKGKVLDLGTKALKDVQLIAPSAVRLGDTVQLGCKWTLEGNETLYSVKWYRGRQEFFSYLPKEYPFTRIFAQPGIDVDGLMKQEMEFQGKQRN
ncbi:hypothetical protein MSG28_007418 [Choristoneura fumiferana]|uniref:Uncharacterized protein n=1 Tax=Choristoneura fumiferana TaxID=7141 RepID=A0ACC0JXR3_CHOFU|nr:hypothetical protein MSG28_007418 [Choristoneura fumiferana]